MLRLLMVLVVPFFAGFVSPWILDDCPADIPRDRFLEVHGDSCFLFKLYEVTERDQAEERCENLGGTLALVKSLEIENYLVDTIMNTLTYPGGHNMWIGLSDKAQENVFVWEDGTPLEYSHWADGYGPTATTTPTPVNQTIEDILNNALSDQDCVAMDPHRGGVWYVAKCHNIIWSMFGMIAYPYICEFRLPLSDTVSAVTTPAAVTNSVVG